MPPVDPGMGTGAPGGILNPIQQVMKVLQAAQAARQGQAQGGGGNTGGYASTAAVGAAPVLQRPAGPILPGGGMNPQGGMLPGGAGMGPSNFPSPVERPQPGPVPGGQEFHTKSARNAQIVSNAANSIIQSVTAIKQQQWQDRRQRAEAVMSQYIAMLQSDDPNVQKQAAGLLQDKKVMKILEKAQKDPTSPEYQGIARAQQEAIKFIQGQQEQQAKLEQIRAQVEAAKAAAGKDKAMTPQTPDERAVAMGTKVSADVERQSASREKVAEIEAGRLTRGQPIIDKSTGQWMVPFYTRDGKLDHYETLQGAPVSSLPTERTSTTTIDSQGRTVTDTTTKKVVDRVDKSVKEDKIKATPSGTPMGQASQFQKRLMLDNAAWVWATQGTPPPSTAFKNAVYARMMQYGMTPAMKPTADMLRRASMATMILAPEPGQTQSVIDRTIAAIEANRAELDKFGNRVVNSIDQFAKVLPPDLSATAANLQSIYTVAAGLHGFRSIKAPEEFKKTFGTISMRPDSLIRDLQELKIFAQTVAATQQQGMAGSTGSMTSRPGTGGPPMGGAPSGGPSGKGTKDDPIVVKPEDIN